MPILEARHDFALAVEGDAACSESYYVGLPHRTGVRPTLVNERLTRWTHEGRTGYGISEYLPQLDDEGRQLVPIE